MKLDAALGVTGSGFAPSSPPSPSRVGHDAALKFCFGTDHRIA